MVEKRNSLTRTDQTISAQLTYELEDIHQQIIRILYKN